MTQITGKLYQMYNKETGANKERRFPITVIEGVLGLSSYLQNQFSSLADIYMPIGGIYQSQTGQEFVYRATPNTIKAKSFTLDRIQGKSLAWNQLVNHINPIVSGDTAHLSCTREPDGQYKLVLTETVNALTDITFCNTINDFYIANHKYCININSDSNLSQYLGYNNILIILLIFKFNSSFFVSLNSIKSKLINFSNMFSIFI